MNTDSVTEGDTDTEMHPCQQQGIDLEEGQQVLFNDRTRKLEVVDRHKRQNTSRVWRRRGVAEHHDVIELQGNGTTYHLLCTAESEHGPVLYKEADWDEEKTDRLGQSPKYSRQGERVESMEVEDNE